MSTNPTPEKIFARVMWYLPPPLLEIRHSMKIKEVGPAGTAQVARGRAPRAPPMR